MAEAPDIFKTQADFLNKVWTDDAFRARLDSDPKAAIEELGGKVPDNIEIKVVRDSDKVKYVHIPAPPPEGEVSDADLAGAQGGTSFVCVATVSIATTIAASATASATLSYHTPDV